MPYLLFPVSWQISMLSVDQVHIVNPGDSVVLECKFHADQYSLFDYPVLWRKSQFDEDIQVNIMGNINEPFLSSNRFETTFTATPPRYGLQLSIDGKWQQQTIYRFNCSNMSRTQLNSRHQKVAHKYWAIGAVHKVRHAIFGQFWPPSPVTLCHTSRDPPESTSHISDPPHF